MKQRFSTRTRLVSALLTLAMVFTFLPISAFAAAEVYVPLNIYTFPDETFREYIGNTFDKDDDGILDTGEREAVTEIYVSKGYNGKKIKDLTGIQWFTNLKTLWCHDNQLTNLDVTQNTELQDLYCGMNQLTSLDVSQNTALKNLVFFKNQLTSLDVGNNKKLEILNCTQNNLTSLDVSQNSALEQLYCDQNNLTSMQVDNCTNLGRFRCDNNKYSAQVYESTRVLDPSTLPGNFDISRVRNLTGATQNADGTMTVNPGGGKVTYEYRCYGSTYETFTLNVTVIPEGIRIYGDNFPNYEFRQYLKANIDKDGNGYLNDTELNIRKLDVSGQYIANLKGIEFFPNLEILYCYNNKLTSLDVSKNPELKELKCYNNKLTSLDVSKNEKLETLYCSKNQLTSLDVSKNTALEYLWCSQNNLTSLDVTQNTALKDLSCYDNQLTSLDVSKNPALEWLMCFQNKLTKLDVSKNTALKYLDCKENNLTSLDVSQTVVTTLKASDSKIDINVEETPRTFDLSTLPGFDVNKVRGWNGGTVSGKTLKVDEGVDKVTYTYDCGKGCSATFTLNVTVVPDGTVTPPSGGDTPGGGSTGGGDGGGAVVIVAAAGAVAAGVVGYGVYNYVSGRKLQALLPEGVAAPENRAQTALLLWNTAGRPEPAEAPAFADVADPDTAKAAQWCVEQGLMKRRLNGKFAPGSSIPAYQVLNAYRKVAG